MPKERDWYFDQLRGLAVLAIVAIHIADINFLDTADKVNTSLTLIYRQLLYFAVPLFLFISGYFLSQKPVNNCNDYKSFVTKQAQKILIPYVIFSIILILIDYYSGEKISFKSAVIDLITGNAAAPYFFIVLIFQYYLLLPLLQKINDSKGLLLAALINLFYFVLLYAFRLNFLNNIFSSYYALFFPAWIFFYQYGLYYRKYLTGKKSTLWSWLLFVSIAIMFLESFLWQKANLPLSFAVSQLRVSSFVYAFCIINVLLCVRFCSKALNIIGLYSMGIFLTHIFIISFMLPLVLKINIYTLKFIYQVPVLILTILVNFLAIFLLQKIFPRKVTQALGITPAG